MNKKDYLEWLQLNIERLYKCDAAYQETAPGHVARKGKTVWPPEVEVFRLRGHPTAKLAYAWGSSVAYNWADLKASKKWDGHFSEYEDAITGFAVVLKIPPVDTAQKAIEVHLEKLEEELRQAKRDLKEYMDEKFSKPFPPTN